MLRTPLLLFISIFAFQFSNAQNIRVINITDEMPYVVHLVEPHQNLFRISKHYKCTVAELKKINRLPTDSLPTGLQLLVPLNKINFVTEISKTKKGAEFQKLFVEQSPEISKKYLKKVLPIDIEKWNEFLKKNKIEFKGKPKYFVGYLETTTIELIPPKPAPINIPKQDSTKIKQLEAVSIVKKNTTAKTDSLKKIAIADSLSKIKVVPVQQRIFERLFEKSIEPEITEQRTALGILPDSLGNYTKGFYAFHNEIKPNTIVKLHNPMNDNVVFVKILGKIPELAGNTRCSIKISRDAAIYLDALDERFLVEIIHR